MSQATLAADYLVVGSGAMGMAFTDVLMNETEATVLMVDRHHQPAGHWNDAYPFVRLHQPSSFYGVNSRKLGSDTIDQTGWNKGLYELATNSEVCAYFDQVMQQQFLPSGRVRYFPMCEYQGDGRFTSLVSGEEFQARAKKVVDSTYMKVSVPSMREPPYEVSPSAQCVPLNQLPRMKTRHESYVVIGAGKTGMDACLWLLKNGVDPDTIRWVMPRDSWLLDRAKIQPGPDFQVETLAGFAQQTEAAAKAESIADLFARLEACGQLLRLDPDVRPTMFRCATVTKAELEQLRRIRNVIRMGRVKRIEADTLVLDAGAVPTSPDALHVDCSADGLARRPVVPVFAGDRITLQSVRTCQQVFSAAFIGHVEAAYEDESAKNELCTVVPHPDSDSDWLRTTLANGLNQARWAPDEGLQAWLAGSRLDGFRGLASGLTEADPQMQAVTKSLAEHMLPAIAKLQAFLAETSGPE